MRLIDLLAALTAAAAMADASAQARPSTIPPEMASAPAAITTSAPAPEGSCAVAAGTQVELEIVEPVASSRHKRGDRFGLRLSAPLLHDGAVCVPAGTLGVGQVVHAMPAHGGGKPGELVLAGRYLEFAGARIPLRGMKANATGASNYGAALGAALVAGPFAMFVRGREIEIPAGALVTARLAEELVLPAGAGIPPAVVDPSVVVDPPVTTAPNQE